MHTNSYSNPNGLSSLLLYRGFEIVHAPLSIAKFAEFATSVRQSKNHSSDIVITKDFLHPKAYMKYCYRFGNNTVKLIHQPNKKSPSMNIHLRTEIRVLLRSQE